MTGRVLAAAAARNAAPTRAAAGALPQAAVRSFTREWSVLTACVAMSATCLDAALMERKHGIFSGGFLAVDHLNGAGEIAAFVAGSFAMDVGLSGVLVWAALWLAAKLRLGAAARRFAAAGAGLAPFVAADVLSYQILAYLGSGFDFNLMFDLVGRRPSELLAVAGDSFLRVVLVLFMAATALVGVVWTLQRLQPAGAWAANDHVWTWRRALLWPGSVFLIAMVLSTAMRLDRSTFDNALRRKTSGRVFGSLVTRLTDFDADGYGLLAQPADPAPFDSRVHPYAIDIPGNGVDEDGVAGDLPADAPPYREPSSAPGVWARRPDVVLILLETFRADALGATLNGRSATPVLDALAARGVATTEAWSHNGYTVQSRFHLFSGSLANVRDHKTLIDDFNANGYDVAYFSGQDETFGGGALPTGYERAQKFYDARQGLADRYSTFTTPGSLAVPCTVLRDRVTDFLAKRDSQRPLFLYVNFHDTHFPYTHAFVEPLLDGTNLPRGDISAANRDALWRTYLNTAANVDKSIGDVLEAVRRTTGRIPAVVVTADHGESLFEEGFLGHGYSLNDAQTRIPVLAADLPITIEQPWGQVQLRDAIARALSEPPGGNEGPRLGATDRPVFQYLGSLLAPAAIAFTTTRGRSIYDFRSNRFQQSDGPWQSPPELDGAGYGAFTKLVQYWEALAAAAQERR